MPVGSGSCAAQTSRSGHCSAGDSGLGPGTQTLLLVPIAGTIGDGSLAGLRAVYLRGGLVIKRLLKGSLLHIQAQPVILFSSTYRIENIQF